MNQTLAAKCTNASFGTQVVDRSKEVGTQLLQFSPRSKIVFFQKLDFLCLFRASEKSNWLLAGKVLVWVH
jgi:hypothetical protein